MTTLKPENIEIRAFGRELDALIAEGAIGAALQPIIDLSRGVVAGYEALARPQRSTCFRHAGEMFEAGSRSGRLWALEAGARGAALEATARWRVGAKLFLNCSPAVLADERFPGTLESEVRARSGLAPGQIVLEITERSEDQYVAGLAERVAELKQMGFGIAIDDVGAGASGLNRIMLLRPRWLKLDRELVTGIDTDRVRQNLVRFMLHFGRLSGVQIIAEGIETETELGALIGLGVRFGQGYLLGRPTMECAPLDPELALRVHQLSARADDGRSRDERCTPASKYGRRVWTIEATAPAAEGLALVSEHDECPGLCVVDEGRLVGWCGRATLLDAGAPEHPAEPSCPSMGALAGACATAALSGTTVPDAVELAACREPAERDAPIVLTEGDQPVLMLMPEDILRAAADIARSSVRAGSAELSALPGRVQCDQFLRRAILEQRCASDGAHRPPLAAAFIDVRDLTSFNCAFGYELGDVLLSELHGLIVSLVAHERPGVFVGRLGDDRFLVVAPEAGLAESLDALVASFDEVVDTHIGVGGPVERTAGEETGIARVGLRVLVVRDALRRVDIPHELYRMEGPLRRAAESIALAGRRVGSQVLFDPPLGRASRRSA